MILLQDQSWIQILSMDDFPTLNIAHKQVLLVVDTGEWYVYHEPTQEWYAQ